MRPPGVYRDRGRLAGACGFKQDVSQLRSVATPETDGLAEYPSLVPTARVRLRQ